MPPSPNTASTAASRAAPAGLGEGERDVVAGRYRLVSFVAAGGMGAVYVAEHVLSRKKVALKVVNPYLCKDAQGVERFRREVSAAAQIEHPGIVEVFDAGVDDDGGFFMAMELLEGESIGDLLRRQWPGMRRAVELVRGMLEPLAKAHEKGFVHRDLKPDNVFIAVDGEGRERVKLLDFGLAREVAKGGPTQTGYTFGTPEYMSPEQAISARQVQAPGDVWAVGVMLYEVLSGTHPFSGETATAIMANAIKEPLPPLLDRAPHVPAPLARVIERCLEKEPAARPQTAGEMLAALESALAGVVLDDTVPRAPVAPAAPLSASVEANDPPMPLGLEARPPPPSALDWAAGAPAASAPAEPEGAATSTLRRRRAGMIAAGLSLGLALAVAAGVLVYVLTEPSGAVAVAAASAPSGSASRTADPGPTGALAAAASDAPSGEVPGDGAPSEVGAADEPMGDEGAAPQPAAAELAADERGGAAHPEPDAPGAGDTPADPGGAERDQARAAHGGARHRSAAPPRRGRARSAGRGRAVTPEPAAPEPAGIGALEEAQAFLGANDSASARRVLAERGRTASELSMLIGLYQRSGQMAEHLETMERFVARFPSHPRTAGYRERLAQFGR